MKKYLRSKNHIKAQQLVIIGRNRKKTKRMARQVKEFSRFALAVAAAVSDMAERARKIIAPLVESMLNAQKQPIEN